ncbi:MAG: hypothetical protein IPK25_00265 [Saprospiraceae bacterium]|nr:hypothetical protein [Saprospiraceae bacterium]
MKIVFFSKRQIFDAGRNKYLKLSIFVGSVLGEFFNPSMKIRTSAAGLLYLVTTPFMILCEIDVHGIPKYIPLLIK